MNIISENLIEKRNDWNLDDNSSKYSAKEDGCIVFWNRRTDGWESLFVPPYNQKGHLLISLSIYSQPRSEKSYHGVFIQGNG